MGRIHWLARNVFALIAFGFSLYFFVVFIAREGVLPSTDLNKSSLVYLSLAVLFLLLPSAKTISIGNVLRFEAKARELKEEISEFKQETRTTLQSYASLITTISNSANQTITVNTYDREAVLNARQELEAATEEKGVQDITPDDVAQYLARSDYGDITIALFTLRMDIERRLRDILEKHPSPQKVGTPDVRYMSISKLFQLLIKRIPEFRVLDSSLRYVLSICNAAVHGQHIEENVGREAIVMGLEIIKLLDTHVESER
ncbi:hypothetical protein [Kordiimonas sp.]|uniref:hypothetical protein n=1 Tax=Kordiimonas sp. TaxID=1970157 RepID=UPI003A908681